MFHFNKNISRFCRIFVQKQKFSTQIPNPKVREYLDTNPNLPEKYKNLERHIVEEKLDQIINKFDRLIYKKAYFELPDYCDIIENHRECRLKPRDIFDLLNSEDHPDQERMYDLLVNKKIKFLLIKMKKDQERSNTEELPNSGEGIFDSNRELVYGLWFNALFLKFTNSCRTRIFTRRLFRQFELPETPTLHVDLSLANEFDYFKLRKLSADIKNLIAENKYETYYPFNLQFVTKDQEFSENVSNLFNTSIRHWMTDKFEHPIYTNFTYEGRIKSGKKIYAIFPNVQKVITVEEILDSDSEFIIPATQYSSIRDKGFSYFRKTFEESGIEIRRLPTELFKWHNHNGAIQMRDQLGFLNGTRYLPDFDWYKHLYGKIPNKIKSKEEVEESAKRSKEVYEKRREKNAIYYSNSYKKKGIQKNYE